MGLILNPQTMRYEFMPDGNHNNINWVQGEAGARAWPIAPGMTAILMDSESSRFYMKSADNTGMPKFRVFEYNEIRGNEPTTPISTEEYATKKEMADIRAEMARISGLLDKKEEIKNEQS